MSATETARDVLRWAFSPAGPPPHGDLRRCDQLVHPAPELRTLLGHLVACVAARLRLGHPPLSDPEPVGCAGLVLAAAIGAAGDPAQAPLARAAFRSASSELGAVEHPAEWVARHAMVAPALAFLGPELAADCKVASPLTSVLTFPPPGQEGEARQVARQLLAHPLGRVVVMLHWGQPTTDLATRRWRGDLLERWRLAGEQEADFVLSVYETTLVFHGDEALEQIRHARQVFEDPKAAAEESCLEQALSVAHWWQPLRALEHTDPEKLRERPHLGYDYRAGVQLARLAQNMIPSIP